MVKGTKNEYEDLSKEENRGEEENKILKRDTSWKNGKRKEESTNVYRTRQSGSAKR